MPGNGHGLDLDDRKPRRLRTEGDSKDVFCMVKASMSVLTYPHAFHGATESFFRKINSCSLLLTATVDEARADELLQMADFIVQDFPHLQRGVHYLRSVCVTLTDLGKAVQT